jgi:hypothetical protein
LNPFGDPAFIEANAERCIGGPILRRRRWTPLETSIQSNLSDYLDGHTSFADFSAWMYRTILTVDQHGDRETAELG